MDEATNEIEAHIRKTRETLSDNFNELGENVKSAMDWRMQFQQRPAVMLALAFGGGVLLSALLPPDRSRRYNGGQHYVRNWRGIDTVRHEAEDTSDGRSGRGVPRSHQDNTSYPSSASRGWDTLKNAFLGLATTRLTGIVEDLLPGFQQEYGKARESSGSAYTNYAPANGSKASSGGNWARTASEVEAD